MIAMNKHSGKLKNWSVKMPNAPYSKRWAISVCGDTDRGA